MTRAIDDCVDCGLSPGAACHGGLPYNERNAHAYRSFRRLLGEQVYGSFAHMPLFVACPNLLHNFFLEPADLPPVDET